MGLIHLGTKLQEQYQIGTDIPYNAPHGSSIGGHCRIPLRETMLRSSADHQSELLITGNTNSTDLSARTTEEMKK
jgi:hypothetical protein